MIRHMDKMVDPNGDQALAARSATGDAAAFRLLLDRHYNRVFRVALGVLREQAEAEDVTQEIWTALPMKLRHWRGEARFTTWLHTITVNAARDALRRSASRARVTASFAELDELSRDEAADTEGRLCWLRTALAALSEDLRETAALVLGEEMSFAEAAEALGIAEGTVAWRMSEIRTKLREMAETETVGQEALA